MTTTTRAGLALSALPLALFPICSLLPPYGASLLAAGTFWAAHACRAVAANASFTASMILVNRAAPPRQVGVANGVSQSLVALVRGCGPAAGGALWAAAAAAGGGGRPLPMGQFAVFLLCGGVAVGGLGVYAAFGEARRKAEEERGGALGTGLGGG